MDSSRIWKGKKGKEEKKENKGKEDGKRGKGGKGSEEIKFYSKILKSIGENICICVGVCMFVRTRCTYVHKIICAKYTHTYVIIKIQLM